MTCIIGALCSEGAVLIADTRILREGYQATNETKFHMVFQNRVVVAGAGATASMDYFADELRKFDNVIGSLDKTIKNVEDSLVKVKSRYLSRMGSDFDIQAIVLGLEDYEKGNPYLRIVFSNGISEKIKRYQIIGHGAPYAATLFGLLYSPILTLQELAILGYFVISAIVDLGIDQTVGVGEDGPEVIVLKKDQLPIKLDTTDDDFVKARSCATSADFKNSLVNIIWSTRPEAYKK